MILPGVQKYHVDLHPLLGFVKNEKRDVLIKKFDTAAVKKLHRGRVQVVGLCHVPSVVSNLLIIFIIHFT